MSSQPLLDQLFEPPPLQGHVPLTPEQLRDSGIEQAFQSAPDELELKYIYAISNLKPFDRLTSETLRQMCGDPPAEYRHVLAGVLKFCVSVKLIRPTGEVRKAERATVHSKDLSVYERLTTQADHEQLKNEFLKRKQKRR